jgi:predicted DNA-binding transcriptional regulator AlpA
MKNKLSPEANILVPKTRRSTALSRIRPIPRRGLSRDEAAMYIGISAGKLDEMVADGRMPEPVKIDSRKLWDIRSLDLAFDALPRENDETEGSTWDDFRST